MTAVPASELASALFSPQAIPDPYPLYERARAAGEVLPLPEWNATLVLSHAGVSAVLRSGAARSGQALEEQFGEHHGDAVRLLRPMMLFHNGASHARLRGLTQAAFTPRVVAEQREMVQARLDALLDSAAGQADFDVVEELAVPLPVSVICQMLGLSSSDEGQFRAWTGSVAELLGGTERTPELMERIERDARDMRAYFRGLADELRARPQPGLLSALAGVEDGGERLSGDELLANAVLLLAAGHETTSNLISGGLLLLSQHPGAWDELTADPRLAAGATEELLRLVSPVQLTGRTLAADLLLGDAVLPAGSHAQLMLAAANRDPAVFPDPARPDFRRPNAARHLAFASGPHYCLGASLARLEGEIVFGTLARRYPGLKVPPQPLHYRPNLVLRGLRALRARLEADGG